MNDKKRTKRSKFLSCVLRHKPDIIGLQLDEQGWASVSELIKKCKRFGRPITLSELQEIVKKCPKKRFSFGDGGTRIRASQGHSVDVDLGYEPQTPPAILFHGTGGGLKSWIKAEGLRRMARHHVHLSADRSTALQVAKRRMNPMIIEVLAGDMATDGHQFYLSDNGVWLVDEVPPQYLRFPKE